MATKITINRALIMALTAIVFTLGACSNRARTNSFEKNLNPIDAITHAHGLAVDVENSSKLYIATHHGLLVLENGKELFRVGKSQDDYMGFSPHPSD